MEAALTKAIRKENSVVKAGTPVSDLSPSMGVERGAPAGLPLFLQASSFSPNRSSFIQRQVEDEEVEEREGEFVQANLIIGQPGDAYEEEANDVSEALGQ